VTQDRLFHVLARDPAGGGSFEEWVGWLDPAGVHFTMSHPPARRLELRFLLPRADAEIRAGGEVLRVDREGDKFVVHARLDGIDPGDAARMARFLEDA